MTITISPEWHHLALYALAGAALLIVLFNIPYVGRVIRGMFSFGLLALSLFLVFLEAPFIPSLAKLTSRIGLDGQEVVGSEVHLKMRPDGHFWANVSINGVERHMLIDTGATMTALSTTTAELAGVKQRTDVLPVVLETANGVVPARVGTIKSLELGGIEARKLKVVISPALGDIDMLGMNFLSQLGSWRVDQNVLILIPRERASGKGSDGSALDDNDHHKNRRHSA